MLIKWFKSKVFIRQLVSFLAVLLPFYIVGTAFFLDGMRTIRRELSASISYQVESYLFSFEKEIDNIKQSIFNCYQDDNVSSLAFFSSTLGDYEKVKAMKELSQRLFAIQNGSNIINEVVVHFRDIRKSISSNGQIKDIEIDDYQSTADQANKKQLYLKYEDNMMALFETFPYNSIETVTPGYVFTVRFAGTGIQNNLDALNSISTGWISLFNSDLSFSMNSGEEDNHLRNIIISFFNDTLNADIDTYLFRHGDSSYMAISHRSNILDLRAIKIIPENEFIRPISSHIGYSDSILPPIPKQTCHLFRGIPAGHSDGNLPL